jgi:uncharacterized protein affecting Mg2+/Co2+ transport
MPAICQLFLTRDRQIIFDIREAIYNTTDVQTLLLAHIWCIPPPEEEQEAWCSSGVVGCMTGTTKFRIARWTSAVFIVPYTDAVARWGHEVFHDEN